MLKEQLNTKFNIPKKETSYFVFQGEITNSAYEPSSEEIFIIYNNGKRADFEKASDINLSVLSKTVKKHFFCYPKELTLK